MSRNLRIEAIHEARYDLESCAPSDQTSAREKLDRLLNDALAASGSKKSTRELLDALHDDYKEFRKMKRRGEWPRL